MLQGRLFSYGDAARYRVGVNHHQIPVNQPRAASAVNSYHRDGAMRVDGNQDYFTQPGDLFRSMTPAQRQALFDNTARTINGALPATVERHIDHCTKADPAYGDGVRRACQAIGAI